MTDIPPGAAAYQTARRDDVLLKACVDEYLHQTEVGPVEGAAPLDHPCVAQAAARVGRLVEFGTTEKIFSHPADERTEAYVRGRYG